MTIEMKAFIGYINQDESFSPPVASNPLVEDLPSPSASVILRQNFRGAFYFGSLSYNVIELGFSVTRSPSDSEFLISVEGEPRTLSSLEPPAGYTKNLTLVQPTGGSSGGATVYLRPDQAEGGETFTFLLLGGNDIEDPTIFGQQQIELTVARDRINDIATSVKSVG